MENIREGPIYTAWSGNITKRGEKEKSVSGNPRTSLPDRENSMSGSSLGGWCRSYCSAWEEKVQSGWSTGSMGASGASDVGGHKKLDFILD